ncbi:MAG: hypothetical protein IJO73_02385 [Clostridia bacterium]|nr:hypothetical protein [Clostridia bacterium]
MEFNENLVVEETAEKVDAGTTEEIAEQVTEPAEERVYTRSQFHDAVNEAAGKRAARKEAKVRKEYEGKYGGLFEVLKAGTGYETVEEMTAAFKEHYEGKGVTFSSSKPELSEREISILAEADANEIIQSGMEEVIEEAERLRGIGVDKMSARDRAVFLKLAEHIDNTEAQKAYAEIGVGKDVYESEGYKEFAALFEGSKTPPKKIYELYTKTLPEKEINTVGSLTQQALAEKEYYTPEEIAKLSEKDLKDPKVWEKVRRSMTS